MQLSQAITNFMNYQKVNLGKKYGQNYRLFLSRFYAEFKNQDAGAITSDQILHF